MYQTALIHESRLHFETYMSDALGIPNEELARRGNISISHNSDSAKHIYSPADAIERRITFANRLEGREKSIDWESVLFARVVSDLFTNINPEEIENKEAKRYGGLNFIIERIPKEFIHQFLRQYAEFYPDEEPETILARMNQLVQKRELRDESLNYLREIMTIDPALEMLIQQGKIDPMKSTREQLIPYTKINKNKLTVDQVMELRKRLSHAQREGLLDYDDNQAKLEQHDIVRRLSLMQDLHEEKRQMIRDMIETQLHMMEIYIASAIGIDRQTKQLEYNRMLKAYLGLDLGPLLLGKDTKGGSKYGVEPSRRITPFRLEE